VSGDRSFGDFTSVSLSGAKLQTKSCVPCGKKEKQNHRGIFLLNSPQGTQGYAEVFFRARIMSRRSTIITTFVVASVFALMFVTS